MSFSNYLEQKLLDHVFGGAPYSQPTTISIGLSTTSIGDDGVGITEPPLGYGYARVQVDNDSETWETATTADGKGHKTTKIDIEFAEAIDGGWGTITHFFIIAGSDVLGSGVLTTPKTINEGDVVRFKSGELIITLD